MCMNRENQRERIKQSERGWVGKDKTHKTHKDRDIYTETDKLIR